jgi:ABC-2 type transport system ATP-binding protein
VSEPEAAVEIEGLRVVRGGRVVLDDLSLRLPAGRVIGLLGPSGCGKSTLLRSIVGVQIVERGTVRVLGLAGGAPALRARVAYATQAASVYDDLGVEENLRYFAAVLGAPAEDVERVLGEVDLTDHAGRPVGRLSGGQRSRASLAVALLGRPELLVLDEPTVGLDPVLRGELWGLFRRLANEGRTLLVSSHVMDEATRCHELLLMRDGAILAQQTPDELLARTGARDVEAAFLALVRDDIGAPV